MTATKLGDVRKIKSDLNMMCALEILTASAGDIPMEREAYSVPLSTPEAAEPADWNLPGDIPLPAATSVILRFTHNEDLDQEISYTLHRRSVISAWPESSKKSAAMVGVDARFKTLRSLFQAAR